jgi:hypothetical protein
MSESGLSIAEDTLATVLAACPTFQSWTASGNAAAAARRIYHDALPPPEDPDTGEYTRDELRALRPYAIVAMEEQQGFTRTKAAVGTWSESGQLALFLIQDLPLQYARDFSAAERAWKTTIGKILDELCDGADSIGLDLAEVRVQEGPYRNDPESHAAQGEVQGVEIAVRWGPNQS